MEKNNTYKAQKRTDYKAPDFTSSHIDLTFELDDEATKVTTVAKYRRLTNDQKAPLVLDGENLKLLSVKLDGIPCKYKIVKDKLEIANVPDEFELVIENVINPTATHQLQCARRQLFHRPHPRRGAHPGVQGDDRRPARGGHRRGDGRGV